MDRVSGFALPFLITRRGVGLLLVAIILFYLAGTTRVGWLLLLDALLWGVLVVSAVVPWLVSGRLRVTRRLIDWEGRYGPMQGDELRMEYSVHNTGRLPAVFVSVMYRYDEATIEAEHEALLVAWLGPGRSMKYVSTMRFGRRGLHRLPQLRVESSFPFGAFRRTTTVTDGAEVLVLPKAHTMDGMDLAGPTGMAGSSPVVARAGAEVVGSRRYAPGDPFRSMHWRSFARLGRPHVKEYEDTPDDALTIVFQAEPRGIAGEEAVEDAVRVAASVGNRVCEAGGRVRMIAGPLDRVYASSESLFHDLAILPYETGPGLAESLRSVPPQSRLLAVVSADDPASVEQVTTAARMRPDMTVVLRLIERERAADLVPGTHERSVEEGPTDRRLQGMRAVELTPGRVPEALRALTAGSS